MGAYSLRLAFLLSLLLPAFCHICTLSCTTYTVKSCDTCYAVSQAYKISLSDFESWNVGIDCDDDLQIGRSVWISAPSTCSGLGNSNGKVFREYIGALSNGVALNNTPISNSVEVHFIVSFAIDYTANGSSPTNGNFTTFWDTNRITPDSVKAIKSLYANVKVMLSLGGASIGGHDVLFQPTCVSSWVSNAVSSLTPLIKNYSFDGIDVDYEIFSNTTGVADFASAIGQLITQLKKDRIISIASIAPLDDVASHYTALWAEYNSSVFDFVNFQFYTYDNTTTPADYIRHYNTAAATYSGGKVLPSFITSDGNYVTPTNVLAACKQLQANNSLPGIFIWSADNSYELASDPNFEYENKAQELLAAA